MQNLWAKDIKYILKILAAFFALFLIWKLYYSNTIGTRHDKACRLHAKVMVHNRDLWAVYTKGAEKAFQERKREFPETGRAVPEYVPGFEQRYGKHLTIGRNPRIGEVVRDDVVIMKDGIVVANFVDFAGSFNTIEGRQFLTCLGNYESNYDRISVAYE